MKQFLRKRWHRVPIGIISAVLVTCLLAGGVFAAYQFFTATAEVKVEEAFTVGLNGGVGMEPPPGEPIGHNYYKVDSGFVCSVTLFPGEATDGAYNFEENETHLMIGDRWFNSMKIINDSSAPLTITFDVSPNTPHQGVNLLSWEHPDTWGLDGYADTVPADGFIMRGIGAVADADAAPGVYTFTVNVYRG